MIAKLFSRRYWWATLLVLVAMAVMVRLGIWQLDRRQQRINANADIVAKLEQAPRSLNEAAAGLWEIPEDRTEVRNIRASATGQFDYQYQVLLTQQNLDSTPGAHLVAPLVLEGSNQAVLVDRGWIPIEDTVGDWSRFNGEPGPVSLKGFLQPSQILFGRAAEESAEADPAQPQEQSGYRTEWYRLDIGALQEQIPYELLPIYLLQSPPPEGNLVLPIRVEPGQDLSEGPHMSYALQWFAFAAIAGIIYLRIVQTRDEDGNDENPVRGELSVAGGR